MSLSKLTLHLNKIIHLLSIQLVVIPFVSIEYYVCVLFQLHRVTLWTRDDEELPVLSESEGEEVHVQPQKSK